MISSVRLAKWLAHFGIVMLIALAYLVTAPIAAPVLLVKKYVTGKAL